MWFRWTKIEYLHTQTSTDTGVHHTHCKFLRDILFIHLLIENLSGPREANLFYTIYIKADLNRL